MSDLISIIMPAYNAGRYLPLSIESVMAQTYTNWELIIVDDGSTDNTADVAKRYQQRDSRIKYIWQTNTKQGAARNNGIRQSTGKLVAFLDADDIWLPDKLTQQASLIQEEDADLVFGYAGVLEGNHETKKILGRGLGEYSGEDAVAFLLYHDAFLMSTVLTTWESLSRAGGFTEDLKIQYCEDWHMWLKLALSGCKFYTDEKVVSWYRVHEKSAAMTEKEEKVKLFYALLDLHLQFPEHEKLTIETKVRGVNLIYHHKELPSYLAASVIGLFYSGHSFNQRIYSTLYRLNVAVFRKLFWYKHKMT